MSICRSCTSGTRRYCGAAGASPADASGAACASSTGYKEYDRSICLQVIRLLCVSHDTKGLSKHVRDWCSGIKYRARAGANISNIGQGNGGNSCGTGRVPYCNPS